MSKASGFTLIEVLVALAITAMIGVAGSSLLIQTMSAGAQVREEVEAVEQLEIARALLQDDFSQIVSKIETPTAGTTLSNEILFVLTRSGWPNPEQQDARSDLQPVAYRFEKQSVVRRAWLRANPVAATPFVDRVVLSDVEKVRIRFHANGVWRDDWPVTLKGTPDLVEVTVEFVSEELLVQSFCVGSGA
ncbi:type II secretion system minor pseudopilin GspJ [Hyphomonas sp.]|uniref:type II secretion system minor pseudopilin GspJ n=1 Tax=Hyphomonas sp. TaxID=87 RepID=UPI0039190558